jgi:hypothetical protein
LDPNQAAQPSTPNDAARLRSIAGKTVIGFGILVLTMTMEPPLVFGENPNGDFFAMHRSSSSSEGGRGKALAPLDFEDDVRREIRLHSAGPLTMRTAGNLVTGHSLAIERTRGVPACAALFEEYAASGVEMMAHTFYVAPSAVERREFCVGGVTAFTQVGSRVTRLCPVFGDVHRRTAALTLIHEALHSAGMTESPSTAGALTPSEINHLVKMACGL